MANEPAARNLWAPEAVWDPERKEWILFWATTIPGRFPDTEGTGDTGYNHRIYSTTTKDFQSFTPARLWFDPGSTRSIPRWCATASAGSWSSRTSARIRK